MWLYSIYYMLLNNSSVQRENNTL